MDIPEPRIQLAPMNVGTVEQVEKLERQCFATPWSLDSLVEELSNPMAVFYTAQMDGTVVGYVGMHHIIDEGYINNIAVAPGYRRQGVATALMESLLAYAKEQEIAMLTLEVRPSNAQAMALYESFDFEKTGQRRDYYTNPVEDAVIMTREL